MWTSKQERSNESFTSAWHNTGDPALQVNSQRFTYFSRRRDTLLRTVTFTFWTDKTDDLIEDSRKPSKLNGRNHL